MLKLNETPRRTSRNFNINNIKLENVEIPNNIKEFNNLKITGASDKLKVENSNNDSYLTYGVGEDLNNLSANKNLKITIDSKINKELILEFNLNNENETLIDNIQIIASENSKATIYLKYKADEKVKGFHSSIIKTCAKENSNINIFIINLLNYDTNNFFSIEDETSENAKLNYTLIDFGGKNSITNLYSNLIGTESETNINTIYLGRENQIIDLNYIAELRGKKSNVNIEVQGALKDNSKKHFKGTIDFKKGCKKAKGNENEFCMLLSENAKSLALPMLLCSEDDVEGNHSTAAGKIGEKELFYIMSRGFDLKAAMKLIVRAKFNNILANIKSVEIKNEIFYEMDKRLD